MHHDEIDVDEQGSGSGSGSSGDLEEWADDTRAAVQADGSDSDNENLLPFEDAQPHGFCSESAVALARRSTQRPRLTIDPPQPPTRGERGPNHPNTCCPDTQRTHASCPGPTTGLFHRWCSSKFASPQRSQW
eukprot:TRINITY_DN93966_c0_g1_i1.p2 TRINITY_DN93966_c0_g1~~TRINITY_DN93966_c0_g1_i1.p2  ORF type:complete len:132 (-),score=4.31 TRINITY_DN93966_c0_g1_i1:64-459(-)